MKTNSLSTLEFMKEIQPIIDDLVAYFEKNPEKLHISDLKDENGCQYVNLVQEGGGVLGIALVGYTYILEIMGLRFLNLAGTSAGSINALFLAALGKPDEIKSPKVLELIANKDFNDFVDGGKDAQALVKAMFRDRKGVQTVTSINSTIRNLDDIKKRLGINPGKTFYDWLHESIGHKTVAEVLQNMNDLPQSLKNKGIKADLALITADLTTETKVVLPKMGDLYFKNIAQEPAAKMVRSSMSVPVFFEPVQIDLQPIEKTPTYIQKWRDVAGYYGEIPPSVYFVDGGTLSNFPMDAFDDDDHNKCPTLGIKLGLDRNRYNNIASAGDIIGASFGASMALRDFEFIQSHENYRTNVGYIDTGTYHWLNFNMTAAEKIDLFKRGALAAADFLKR